MFELWDAGASGESRTEEALSNAKRVARNAVSSCCAKNARRMCENGRSPPGIKGKRNAPTCSA
ncbi:hypothetical protein C9I56_21165 [Paraburkholderia caribensis]|uniref:Uncharacterized protein n=1 Tax=Paraburkholderia caribensis TaxID=75105 RepID=A0A9Q6S5Y8_9BURK|nr:hypothetical protein AN416_22155 [Paraburkholderia caribensis]AMV46840.1 hypothetical protein ATN79_33360 [Paraburkholderia caribensis]AUT55787.1 hypothetical protein C2L66_29385 [Paraburkholderia caribensis]PTB26849.1 hypothetical protein C9I56_21165 [Paraburkholderia caribensis]QLB65210.1 hypothetical protein A9O66_22725 [Paraburkholderia caribensis]